MAGTLGGGLYGVVGQPLTKDYLAKQLPIFQPKVPTNSQPTLQFPTNSPANLPLPALHPGEVIRFQQNRVVCTDTFNEPAVGAVYLTNYRIIFYGNLISDPESIDDFQDSNQKLSLNKKDSISSSEPSSSSNVTFPRLVKFKPFSVLKGGEPSFKSFLMTGDPDLPKGTPVGSPSGNNGQLPQQLKSHTRKFRTELKKRIGSIHRYRHRKHSASNSLSNDLTDSGASAHHEPLTFEVRGGVGAGEETIGEESQIEGCVAAETTVVGVSNTKSMPKILYFGCQQDAESLDSLSVSSASEFSATGTDDRSTSSPGDVESSHSGAMDVLAEQIYLYSGGGMGVCESTPTFQDLSLEISDSSRQAMESGINVRKPEALTVSNVAKGSLWMKKGLSPPAASASHSESDSDTENGEGELCVVMDETLQGTSCTFDSDWSGKDNHNMAGTLKDGEVGIQKTSNARNMPSASPPGLEDIAIKLKSEQEVISNPQSTLESGITSASVNDPSFPYCLHDSNCASTGKNEVFVVSPERGRKKPKHPPIPLYGNPSPFKPTAWRRNKSSSLCLHKKPKPLPKLTVRKKQPLHIYREEKKRKALFISSLPADFKPVPFTCGDMGDSCDVGGGVSEGRKGTGGVKSESCNNEHDIPGSPVHILSNHSTPQYTSSNGDQVQGFSCPSGQSLDADLSSGTCISPACLVKYDHTSCGPVPLVRKKRETRMKRSQNTSEAEAKGLPVSMEHRELQDIESDKNDLPSDIISPEGDELINPLQEGIGRMMIRQDFLPYNDFHVHERVSQNSMTVFDGSSPSSYGSGIARTHSLIYSGDDPYHLNIDKRSSDLFTSAISMPMLASSSSTISGFSWSTHQMITSSQSLKVMSPASTRYSLCVSFPLHSIHAVRKLASVSLKELSLKLPEGLLILCRNFHSIRLHIHPQNTYDADSFKELLERTFLVDKPLHELFAFQYQAAIRHPNPTFLHNRSLSNNFTIADEMTRFGLRNLQLWTVRSVLAEHPDLCPSYPSHVIVPSCTGDLDLIRGAKLYKEGRFPTLTWYDRHTGAALLRAGGTKEERGQFGTYSQMDEALLQAISGCKLNHNGPPMTLHIFTEKPDYGHHERNAEQVRTFYYHNCKFNYSFNPPTFRNVRHSFIKLQAMLENKLPDEDYLFSLDGTHWLPRLSVLLSTSYAVCSYLRREGAHVLVCYEAGWDRTTQVVSLAQLLMDPYYRTMDGFQVLIQKEWLWFGHPFRMRHSCARGKTKEDGPIFLQWADCVWQVMQQSPSAFEFNEHLLVSMVEHSYSNMFGTFTTNNEASRKQFFTEKGYEHMNVSTHTISFWTWVDMVNAAGSTFYNEIYDASCYGDIIKPQWALPCLKLWTSHYCKYKPNEHNSHDSFLLTQLAGLNKTIKELEANYAKLAPSAADEGDDSDDFQSVTARIRENSMRTPALPCMPAVAKQYKYDNLEEFLVQGGFDTSICKHLVLGTTSCQGLLYKQGAVRKNWLQRWFALDFNRHYFAYFENQQAYANKETPKGVICLREITRVFQDLNKREHLVKNIFMVETPHRTYLMQAPSITSMYIWIACLELPASDLKLGTS